MENNTAKHFVLQLGSLITLYLSITFLIVLLFGIVNTYFPDPADIYSYGGDETNIRLGIAMLIVFFPTYLLLTRIVNTSHRQETNHTYLGLTKWLMYLSLLVGGGVILGDLVVVINTYLSGEVSTRFIFKALLLLLVVGATSYYYWQDVRGYWLTREKASVAYAGAMSLLVLLALIFGFMNAGTPAETREIRLDQTQIQDLQNIQSQLEGLLYTGGTLPPDLSSLYEGFPVPTAPEDREPYAYEVTEKGFKLCATFAYDSSKSDPFQDQYQPYKDPNAIIFDSFDWKFLAGNYCFERVVNQNVPTQPTTKL